MLRFQPDSWLDGLLRPLVLLDPVAGTYYELAAPDLRPIAFLVLLAVCMALGARELRNSVPPPIWRLVFVWLASLYVWTFVTGNGRYFIAGLLVVGLLLVWALRQLRTTVLFRASLGVLLLTAQGGLVWSHYQAGQGAILQWHHGGALALPDHPARDRPVVIVTLSSISYSALVPQFHPQSRWSNLAGQRDIVPGMWEYGQLQDLLDSPLPRYLLAPAVHERMDEHRQPSGVIAKLIDGTLGKHRLALQPGACEVLQTALLPNEVAAGTVPPQAFWLCPLQPGRVTQPVPESEPERLARESRFDRAFSAVEGRCPRFFPPGGGLRRMAGEITVRHYLGTDMRLMAEPGGLVLMHHLRAINPTPIGQADEVAAGRMTLDCRRIPGRYTLPWNRD